MNCTFHDVVGTECGFDNKDRSHNTCIIIVPLTNCRRDITSHKSQLSFHGVETEV